LRIFARRVDKVAGDGALGVPSAAALTAACETALDWQAKAQALERQLAEVLERERRAAEERKRAKQADLKLPGGGASDGGWDSASAASNEKVLYIHTIMCVCVCACACVCVCVCVCVCTHTQILTHMHTHYNVCDYSVCVCVCTVMCV
jgi:hypothetical protein